MAREGAMHSIVDNAGMSDALVFLVVPCILVSIAALAAFVPALHLPQP